MPKIPVSNRLVQEKVLTAPQVSARMIETKGAGTAIAGLGNAVSELSNFMKSERDKAETLEIDRARALLRKKSDELYHNKVDGFITKNGENTIDEYDKFQKGYNKFADDVLKNTKSERVREKLRSHVENFKTDFTTLLDNRTAKEMDAFYNQQTQANLDNLAEHAAVGYLDLTAKGSSKVAESIAEQKSIIDKYAERNGIPKAEKEKLYLKHSSKLMEGVIDQALTDEQDALAETIFKQAKKQKLLDSDTIERLSKSLDVSSVRRKSQEASDNIINKNLSMGESLKKVREIQDPKIRDATEARVTQELNRREAIKKDNDRRHFDGLIKQMEQFKSIDSVPPKDLARLSEKKKKVLKDVLDMISKGYDPSDDPRVVQDLRLMASVPELRNDFLNTDINESAHKLSRATRNSLLKLQSDIRSGKGVDKVFKNAVASTEKVANLALDSVKIKDKDKRALFKQRIYEAVDSWQQAHGKLMPFEEVQKLSDSLLYDVTVVNKGWFWDSETKKKAYEIKPDDQVSADWQVEYSKIPFTTRKKIGTQIIREKQARGETNPTVSEQEITNVFQKFIKGL